MNKNKKEFTKQLQGIEKQLMQLRILIFLIAVVIVYAYMGLRIHILSDARPNQKAVASQSAPAQPQIDEVTVSKIKQLQDNSVSVQALFNQARQSPFQE